MFPFFEWLFSQYKGVAPYFIALEIVAALFGLLSVLFAKKSNLLVYPTGIVSTIISVYLFYKTGLFGDMLINFYYTIMSLYGWYSWNRHQVHLQVDIEKTSGREWGICLLLGVFAFVLVGLVYYFRPIIQGSSGWEWENVGLSFFRFTDWVDMSTTALFLIGMWLMAKRKIENWLFWIVGDVISVPLYYHKNLIFSSFQYLIFTFIAIFAYLEWKNRYNKSLRTA